MIKDKIANTSNGKMIGKSKKKCSITIPNPKDKIIKPTINLKRVSLSKIIDSLAYINISQAVL